jgi:hypothetical protein
MNNRTFSHIMGSSTFSFTASISSSSSLVSSIKELVNILRDHKSQKRDNRLCIHLPLKKAPSAKWLGKE